MPDLIIYIPFKRKNDSDLRRFAKDLEDTELRNLNIQEQAIANIKIVFMGEEHLNTLNIGDFLCVNAHGGSESPNVSDNAKGNCDLGTLVSKLEILQARNARGVYFLVCFSSLQGHIAANWKRDNPAQEVWGSHEPCEGAMISINKRRSVRKDNDEGSFARGSIFDKNSKQLQKL